ncbi:MAG: cob(I)yrinic acid a,c-diamide adenosyltransferase [Syntrophomonadaceae bacterium]|nr:cob(I)yrinic acid a,c-diamide adenosyltransferase [Bacillota bacterium]NLM88558.1 cob(I)yrinic acid a,c-diamide adenosyltransferase [Syntrophomonadaceae bacterium]HQA49678.1 cob(I)yrinic acid a,c-diamide adenosyltransferase [Syntrophomonadaceae bacterium]HQD89675.1 cob(I)yrinic acid a,c-diamide adenosyltransferase [Syntrophomonadaceae bacterium]
MKIIFTGPGKGKTSAAAGTAFRSWGQGRKVLVILFLKDQRVSGEWKAVSCLDSPGLVVKSYGRKCPYIGHSCCPGEHECIVDQQRWEINDEEQARQGLAFAEQEIKSGRWNLIVLDEILNLWSIWPAAQPLIVDLLKKTPPDVDLILTGRNCTQELVELVDLVTSMQLVKHPFHRGIQAQKGIDY